MGNGYRAGTGKGCRPCWCTGLKALVADQIDPSALRTIMAIMVNPDKSLPLYRAIMAGFNRNDRYGEGPL